MTYGQMKAIVEICNKLKIRYDGTGVDFIRKHKHQPVSASHICPDPRIMRGSGPYDERYHEE